MKKMRIALFLFSLSLFALGTWYLIQKIGIPMDSESNVIEVQASQLKDIEQILTSTQVAPSFKSENNEFQGFQFIEFEAESLLKKIGLQKGDIVTAVNGNQIGSPMEAMNLYLDVKEKDLFKVQVLRQGIEKELYFKIKR